MFDLGSVINMVDVELVVISGGITEKLGQDLADRIAREAQPWILHPSPKLKFVGAASIGRARLLDGG